MRIEVVRGDITRETVDAVVNAANSTLLGGGGVDGAIHAAAGPALLAECRSLRADHLPDGLPVGDAVITPAFDLQARWIVHTVGPQHWEHDDGGASLLASCHTRSLEECDRVGATTVAFPAISCGAYGWTAADAAPIAVDAVRRYAAEAGTRVTLVRFVTNNDAAFTAFSEACSRVE